MGKNSSIKSLGKCIGNVVFHELLLRHTKIPESEKHINDEIRDYVFDVEIKAQEFSWTEEEKSEIEDRAFKRAINRTEKYPDLEYEESEIHDLLSKMMEKLFLR